MGLSKILNIIFDSNLSNNTILKNEDTMSYQLKATLFLIFVLIIISCSKDESPTEPATTGTVSGVIIDGMTNSTIVNVSVFSKPATSFVTTDANGKYEIKNIEPGEYTMFASKVNYDSMSVNISVVAGSNTISDFTMRNADSLINLVYGGIEGIVRDYKDDSPIANVTIRTQPVTASVTTDANGKFSLSNIVAGTYAVYAEKSNFETVNISVAVVKGLSTTADFFLSELDTNALKLFGTISGTIKNSIDNSLIENVSIRTIPPTSIISTDRNGEYSLSNITPGNYTIYAEKTNFDTSSISIAVQKGITTIADFFITELDTNAFITTGSIVGKIIDAKTGVAIQEAVITTTPPTSSVTSDANGIYKIVNLQPGDYSISVTKYGFQNASTSIMVFVGQSTNADISLAEQSTGTISGVVRDDSTDVPIRGVSITTEPGTSSVTTDSLGHYTIVNLEPSQYSVIAQKLGYVSAQVSVLVIAEEQTTADIALQKK